MAQGQTESFSGAQNGDLSVLEGVGREGIGRLRDGREVLRTKEGTRHAQERKMIVRRVKAGLAARKAKGLRLGRVPLPMKTLNHAPQQISGSLFQ